MPSEVADATAAGKDRNRPANGHDYDPSIAVMEQRQTMTIDLEKVSLTTEERAVLDKSAELWNAFLALDNRDVDLIAVQNAVHLIQGIIAVRVAKRVNPEVWN